MQRKQIAQTFPMWLAAIAKMGLACTVFGAQVLRFGTHQPAQQFTSIAIAIFCVFILTPAILKRIRTR